AVRNHGRDFQCRGYCARKIARYRQTGQTQTFAESTSPKTREKRGIVLLRIDDKAGRTSTCARLFLSFRISLAAVGHRYEALNIARVPTFFTGSRPPGYCGLPGHVAGLLPKRLFGFGPISKTSSPPLTSSSCLM